MSVARAALVVDLLVEVAAVAAPPPAGPDPVQALRTELRLVAEARRAGSDAAWSACRIGRGTAAGECRRRRKRSKGLKGDFSRQPSLEGRASGASWVSIHNGGGVGIGYAQHAGQVTVADGTKEMAARIERVLTNDPGMGILRHVDAGYPEAVPRNSGLFEQCAAPVIAAAEADRDAQTVVV